MSHLGQSMKIKRALAAENIVQPVTYQMLLLLALPNCMYKYGERRFIKYFVGFHCQNNEKAGAAQK